LAGFLAHLIGFYWLVNTISVFGGFPYAVSAVVFLIYAALQGLQMALFALLVKRFGYGPLCLLPPAYWIAIEFWVPLLFPWYLANTQIVFTSFIQSADLVGPYGASLILMWFNAALYHGLLSWKDSRRIRWRPLLVVALLVIASVIYGFIRLAAVTKELQAAPKLDVAAVQGNIDIDLKWNPLQAQHNLQAHQRLTEQASGAALVIWPESAVEFWLPDNLQQLPSEVTPALKPGGHFIFGAKSFTGQLGAPNFKAFNTAFFADAKGRVLDRYHKQVLLAFGEYLPFAGLLAKLPGIPFADGFTAGDGPRTFVLFDGYRIAPLICYEDLMPELSRRFVKDAKADLLVNLTNDAWYGRTVAPWQHARLSQWRAIETRRTLFRVTNTGITSVINARGELTEALPIFAPGVLKAQVEILEGETLYVRFGDWFPWAMTFATLGLVLLRLRHNRRWRMED
jgi:apolipoprotein N-acyltransferase